MKNIFFLSKLTKWDFGTEIVAKGKKLDNSVMFFTSSSLLIAVDHFTHASVQGFEMPNLRCHPDMFVTVPSRAFYFFLILFK